MGGASPYLEALMYQTIHDKKVDRSRHVWMGRKVPPKTSTRPYSKRKGGFKCVTCGAITFKPPPDMKDEVEWVPEGIDGIYHEPIMPEEKTLVPPGIKRLQT